MLSKNIKLIYFYALLAMFGTFCFADDTVDPSVRESRDKLCEEIGGSEDLAAVAEWLAKEGFIDYQQLDTSEIYQQAKAADPANATQKYKEMKEKWIPYAKNIRYTTIGNCFEFVQLVAWIAGKCKCGLYSYGNSLSSAIDKSTMVEWDMKSPIPRGKVIVGTLARESGGQGRDNTFHFGISLGNGMVASNGSAGWFKEGGVRIEPATTAFNPWMYWWHEGKVYYGDFPHFGKPCDEDKTIAEIPGSDKTCVAPDPRTAQEQLVNEMGIPQNLTSTPPQTTEEVTTDTVPGTTPVAAIAGAQVVCPPCQALANALSEAKKEQQKLKDNLSEAQKKREENLKRQSEIKQQSKAAKDRFNKAMETEASGTDPAGTKREGRYTPDGDIEVTTTYPDGRTETKTTSSSKFLKGLLDQMKAMEEELAQLQNAMPSLLGEIKGLESQLTALEQQIAMLEKALKDCIEKYCKKRPTTAFVIPGSTGSPGAVLVVFDRADCKFGGGSISVPIRSDFILDAPSQPVDAPPVGGTVPTPGTPGGKPDDTPAPGSTPAPTDKPVTPSPTSRGDRPGASREVITRGEPVPIPVPVPTPETQEKPPEEKPPTTPETPPETPQPPTVVIIIVKATETVMKEGATSTQNVPETLMKIPGVEPPLTADNPDVGFDEDPNYPEKRPDGTLAFKVTTTPAVTQQPGDFTIEEALNLDLTAQGGDVLGIVYDPEKPQDQYVDGNLTPYVKHNFRVGNTMIVVLQYPVQQAERIAALIQSTPNLQFNEPNFCRIVLPGPTDPYYLSKSSWKQEYDDQWAIKRVGLTADANSPWNIKEKTGPVVVAVVDTGLDWNHQDISWENLWQNSREIPENGLDDDKNGYIDDIIGFDFYRRNNMPWDQSGHGTFVAGIIGASHNGKGIAGINPNAKIMALKALNSFGHTRASYLAEAITYAANNGARVINVSVGGPNLTRVEQLAIDYAYSKGAVVVVAAGNEASDITNYSPAGLQNVLTVSSTNIRDQRAAYSNWGAPIDVAAPGDDVLSLRARRTDLMRDVTGVKYAAGQAYVGVDKRYYRASGTSFAAPIVAGTASLLFSIHPELTNEEVERMIVQSAKDIDVAGRDQHTGYGLLDAKAAIAADRAFFINVNISGVKVITEGAEAKVQVTGTAEADRFKSAHLEIGAGKTPAQWKRVSADLTRSLRNGVLGAIAASEFRGAADWTIRVVAEHQSGKSREAWFYLKLQ